MDSHIQIREQVLTAFLNLKLALDKLHNCMLSDSNLIAWVDTDSSVASLTTQSATVREKAFSIINQLEYLENQAPREILVCAGFIGSSPETMQAVASLNTAKDEFKKAMIALRSAKILLTDPYFIQKYEGIFNNRSSSTSHTLRKMGLARLHLKQCYRKCPILTDVPKKIRWTWANTRSITRISHVEAEELLKKKGDDVGIMIQLKKLYALKSFDHLAIVQDLAPHLRANILFSKNANKERCMVKGPVPIFFPATSTTEFPDFKAPDAKKSKDKNRLIRSDLRIESFPYLPAIRAHRYFESSKDVQRINEDDKESADLAESATLF